jgi:hypothetical protein
MTKPKTKRITHKLLELAAKNTYGDLTKISLNIGVAYITLKKYLLNNPLACSIIGVEQDKLIDMCETKLRIMALSDEFSEQTQFKAVTSILNAKAKERGYGNNNIITINHNQLDYYNNLQKELISPENKIKKILEIKKTK